MLRVETLETTDLGDRSYIAHDGSRAVVIDPQRDIDRVEERLDALGLSCEAVFETHIHNDYLTGGLELARRTKAGYFVTADEPVRFEREPIRDGDRLRFGALEVAVLGTPGHTDTHLAYAVEADDGDGDPAVFTGGSLLYGSVGRTDLVDPARTDELTRAQFRSAHRLAKLPGHTQVYPTHGFGSFCSSGSATGATSSTIADEILRNDALTADDEDAFVTALVSGLTAYPAYYAHMGPGNLAGPGPIDLSLPRVLDPRELRERLEAGEWVIDLRSRRAYAAAHLPGSVGIELGTSFSTYLGWLVPWGSPLTLIGESPEQIRDAQRQLVRIGFDRPDAVAIGTPAELADGVELGSYEVADFADLAAADDPTVVDLRRDDERAQGSIPGSLHIPLHALEGRIAEIPDGTAWLHCRSGMRASIGAGLLARAGHRVVLVDDDFDAAQELGLA